VLLATADPRLRGELQRLAAGAGCDLHSTADLDEVRRSWSLAAAVLTCGDLAAELATLGLPRRDHVHLVAESPVGPEAWRAAVTMGAETLVELPEAAGHLSALLGDLADRERPPGRVVGVVGGSGGVGASVLTVATATVAASQGPAVAVDLDPDGAGLELLAGLEREQPLRWQALAEGRGRLGGSALREALARERGVPVLGWGAGTSRTAPATAVVNEALSAARRGHAWVVVDASATEAGAALDAIVLVVAGTVPGIAAAGRRLGGLPTGVPVGLAVRSAHRDRWGRDVSRALGLPLWTVVTHQRGLDDHLSAGLGPVRRRRSPLSRAAGEILRAVGTTP
jgi:secretion/DNA translocation related CpaE-like protein